MFAFAGDASGESMGSMSMSRSMPMSTSPRLDPGVAFFVALSLFGFAIFTVGSSKKGASHHGSHVPVSTRDLGAPVSDGDSAGAGGHSDALLIETLVTTPWVEDASTVAMCVAMGFLLILMI